MISVNLTEIQYEKITESADKLRKSFLEAAKVGSYEKYLEFIRHSEVMSKNIDEFKKTVHDISGRKVRMSDQKLIELFDDLWDDYYISRMNISRLFLEPQQLKQFDQSMNNRQRTLKQRYLADTAPSVIKCLP